MKPSRYVIVAVPLLLAFAASPVASLTFDQLSAIEPHLTSSQANSLLTKGSITRYFGAHQRPALIPNSSLSPGVKSDVSSLDYTTGVETLYLAKEGGRDKAATMLAWYNVLRSISTLKGVKYYDLLSRRMKTLFFQSYVVDNSKNGKRIPDPLVTKLPAESTITIMQHDSRFGSNYYRVRYLTAPDAISMTMTNLTTLRLLFIPVVSPGGMQLHLIVMPWRGSRLFYGSVEIKAATMLGLKGLVRDAFRNRIVALYGWFSKRASRLGP